MAKKIDSYPCDHTIECTEMRLNPDYLTTQSSYAIRPLYNG